MKAKKAKPKKAWALVTKHHGAIPVLAGQLPIYWNRRVAKAECDRQNGRGDFFRVARVIVSSPAGTEG